MSLILNGRCDGLQTGGVLHVGLSWVSQTHGLLGNHPFQWIDLRENLQENPIFNGEIHGFLQIVP